MSFSASLLGESIRFPVDTVVEASAPCRINCGGTWDLPAFALPFEWLNPTTVNIALELRTRVRLTSCEEGRLIVSSTGFPTKEYPSFTSPFDSRLGLVSAIVSCFGLHGLHVQIESTSPPRSGLGGSGAVAVALIGALNELGADLGLRQLSQMEIAVLAHRIEDGLGVSLTGLQDQVAALYGGVNQWIWKYSSLSEPFQRRPLVPQEQVGELEKHLLIAYTGAAHESSQLNQMWINDFLAGTNRDIWYRIHSITNEFASAISATDWDMAAQLLGQESDLRAAITPEMIPSRASDLMDDVKELSCGARFAGAGGGGCVWAIGEATQISSLEQRWRDRLDAIGGRILPSTVAREGLVVKSK